MKKLYKLTCLLIILLSVSGCVSNKYILRSKQKALQMKGSEGVILFTAKVKNFTKSTLSLNSYSVQEVNQYKFYEKLLVLPIPLTKEHHSSVADLFLCTAKLPAGTYKLSYFTGMLWPFQCFLISNKVFDVSPGSVTYGGRLHFKDITSTNQGSSDMLYVLDGYDKDVEIFKNRFPVLRNRTILKDLIY